MTLDSNTALVPSGEDMLQHMILLYDWTRVDYPNAQFEVRAISPVGKGVRSQKFACTDAGYDEAAQFATKVNCEGYNTYVTVNPIRPTTSGQAKDIDVEVARYQFIDLDGVASPDQHIEDRCNGFRPAFRVLTGSHPIPRLHAYWQMSEPTADLDAWRTVQKGLAAAFDSDPAVVNPARILRLAGSISYPDAKKAKKGYITELVRLELQDAPVQPCPRSAFADAFRQPEPEPADLHPGDAADDIGGSVPVAVVEAALRVIPPVATEGRRNFWLDIACAAKDANPSARMAFERWQRMSPLYRRADDKVWDTLTPSPASYLSLFRHAMAAHPDWWRDNPEVANWWRDRAARRFPQDGEPSDTGQPTGELTSEQIIADLAARHAAGHRIDVEMCIAGLPDDPAEVRKVREFVVKTLKVRAVEFDKAIQQKAAEDILGASPETASEFIAAYVDRHGIICRYNGVLWREGNPADDIGFHELQRNMRVLADELRLPKLGIGHPQINDAAEKWYGETRRARRAHVVNAVRWNGDFEKQKEVQADLHRLAGLCFDCAEGPDFVVAVFLKFIHQVKSKMGGIPVNDHLMPVLLNPMQGIGKTTFVQRLVAPVEEVSMPTDFRQVTDDRIITLWQNFVLSFDEMGYASRADLDTVRHVITAPTLTRRPMRSNVSQQVQQNATLIGTANAMSIGDLITDPAGVRRFVGLMMRDKPDWPAINAMDWVALWRSVDPAAADPIAHFKAVLRTTQEADREKAPVEVWQEQIDPDDFLGGAVKHRRLFSRDELFADFHPWEADNFPRHATTVTKFARELGRIARQCPASAKFAQDREASGRGWKWVGDVPDSKVVRRMYA